MFAGTGEGYFREEIRGTGLPLRGGGIFRDTRRRRRRGSNWPPRTSPDFHWVNDLELGVGDKPSDLRRDAHRRLAVARTAARRGHACSRRLCAAAASTWRCGPIARTMCCLRRAVRTSRPRCIAFREPPIDPQFEVGPARAGMGRTSLAIAPSNPDFVYALAASNDDGPGVYRQGLLAVYRSTAAAPRAPGKRESPTPIPYYLNTLLLTNVVGRHGSGLHTIRTHEHLHEHGMVRERDRGRSARSRARMGRRRRLAAIGRWRTAIGGWRRLRRQRFLGTRTSISTASHSTRAMTARPIRCAHRQRRRGVSAPATRGRRRRPALEPRAAAQPRGRMAVAQPRLRGDAVLSRHAVSRRHALSRRSAGQRHHFGARRLRHRRLAPVFGGDGGIQRRSSDAISIWLTRIAVGQDRPNDQRRRTRFTQSTIGLDASVRICSARAATICSSRRSCTTRISHLDLAVTTIYIAAKLGPSWTKASAGGCRLVAASAPSPWSPRSNALVGSGTDKGDILLTRTHEQCRRRRPVAAARPRSGWVTSVAFDPRADNVLYATYGNFGGAHVSAVSTAVRRWQALTAAASTGLPDIPVHSIVVDPDDSLRLYLGTDLGVFVSASMAAHVAGEETGFGPVVTMSCRS